jgi:hypothetical protein
MEVGIFGDVDFGTTLFFGDWFKVLPQAFDQRGR